MKRMRFAGLFLAVAILGLPIVALAAASTFEGLALEIVKLLNTATFVLIMFGLAMYFWGMVKSIPHFGDEKGGERRTAFFWWGIIVLFVMVSIWGIVQLLQNTLLEDHISPATGEPRYDCWQGGDNCPL